MVTPTMRVQSAKLPTHSGDDRLFVTSRGVIVLDGATSHGPDELAAGDYVDHLGQALVDRMDGERTLPDVLAAALRRTIDELGLIENSPYSPSSTVAMTQVNKANDIDLLVLGDSTIVAGNTMGTIEALCDERLDSLALPQRERYRARLQEGSGFDDNHRAILGELQQAQRALRNRPNGYWIASTDPSAARHAISVTRPSDKLDWLILATDGAADTLAALKVPWCDIAEMDGTALTELLDRCNRWEQTTDPNGLMVPRSKRHDDKTIAVVKLH